MENPIVDPNLKNLARAVSVPVGGCSGGWLATMLVTTINVIIFYIFFLSRDLISWKECSDPKTYLAKVDRSA